MCRIVLQKQSTTTTKDMARFVCESRVIKTQNKIRTKSNRGQNPIILTPDFGLTALDQSLMGYVAMATYAVLLTCFTISLKFQTRNSS